MLYVCASGCPIFDYQCIIIISALSVHMHIIFQQCLTARNRPQPLIMPISNVFQLSSSLCLNTTTVGAHTIDPNKEFYKFTALYAKKEIASYNET